LVTDALHVSHFVARTIDMPSDGVADHEASEVESGVSRAILSLDNVWTTGCRRIHDHITAVIAIARDCTTPSPGLSTLLGSRPSSFCWLCLQAHSVTASQWPQRSSFGHGARRGLVSHVRRAVSEIQV